MSVVDDLTDVCISLHKNEFLILPAASTVTAPAGTPSPRAGFCLSSSQPTAPTTNPPIPQTICSGRAVHYFIVPLKKQEERNKTFIWSHFLMTNIE